MTKNRQNKNNSADWDKQIFSRSNRSVINDLSQWMNENKNGFDVRSFKPNETIFDGMPKEPLWMCLDRKGFILGASETVHSLLKTNGVNSVSNKRVGLLYPELWKTVTKQYKLMLTKREPNRVLWTALGENPFWSVVYPGGRPGDQIFSYFVVELTPIRGGDDII